MATQSFILTGPQDALTVQRRAEWVGYPCTVSISAGLGRTGAQNRLAQRWAADVSAQMGDRSPEQVRGYFKLHHGVPIRREDPVFLAVYDERIRHLPYETKLALMMVPIDLPVTRDMKVKELTRYLDSIQAEFLPMGIRLTDPDELRYGRGPIGLKADRDGKDPAYLAAIHDLPCCICVAWGFPQTTPTQAHHTICGRYGQHKTPDRQAIPLCRAHHTGPDGIHTRRKWWVETFGADTDFIAATQDAIAGELTNQR